MHPANWLFWTWVAQSYHAQFKNRRVVEVGSRQNMDRRSLGLLFRPLSAEYVGVDWISGRNVDIVGVWHEVPMLSVDVVISASMLEHDPYHDQSIAKMADVLIDDGWLFLSWGAALNDPHCVEYDPSGASRHYSRPAEQTVRAIENCGFDIGIFVYERDLGMLVGRRPRRMKGRPGTGEVCLIARKGKWLGKRTVDGYLKEDKVASG